MAISICSSGSSGDGVFGNWRRLEVNDNDKCCLLFGLNAGNLSSVSQSDRVEGVTFWLVWVLQKSSCLRGD